MVSTEVRSELLTVISPNDLPDDAHTWLNYNFKDNWTSEVYPLIKHDPVFEYLIKEELTDFVYQMVYFDKIEMPMPPDDWDIWTDSPVNYNLPHPAFYPYNDNVKEWLDGDSDEAYEALEKLHKLDHSSPEFDALYKRLIVSNGPKPEAKLFASIVAVIVDCSTLSGSRLRVAFTDVNSPDCIETPAWLQPNLTSVCPWSE